MLRYIQPRDENDENDRPLDASTLTAIRTLLAAAALGVAVVYDRINSKSQMPLSASKVPAVDDSGEHSEASIEEHCKILEPGYKPGEPISIGVATPPSDSPGPQSLAFLSLASTSVVIAGIELGLYNFGGTALQAMGLQLMSATRAGFVIQSTALLTPAIAHLAVGSQGGLAMT
jgi:hypothetical protein